jgi:mono/diheme cytochrome c family protein
MIRGMNIVRRTPVFLLLIGIAMPVVEGAEPGDDRKLFLQLCAPCHGPDGRARTRAARQLKVKDLTKSRTTDTQIRKQIREGWFDKRGERRMPAFGNQLTVEPIAALVGEVQRLRKWPSGSPFSRRKVRPRRRHPTVPARNPGHHL